MKKLKYTIIKNTTQYDQYCNKLEKLIFSANPIQEEIELLTLLIEKWDEDNNSFHDLNPVELLKALMEEHNMKAKDLASLLDLSKGTVSKMLNYQKGLSKTTIRKLATHFKVAQSAFNRPYRLAMNNHSGQTAGNSNIS